MKNILLLIMMIAIVFVSGCSKTPTTPNPIIYDNMSDTVVDTQDTQNDTVVVDEPVIIVENNTVIINDTIIDPIIDNTTVVIDEPVNDDDSDYSEYRDTGLIDESIDDLELLN